MRPVPRSFHHDANYATGMCIYQDALPVRMSLIGACAPCKVHPSNIWAGGSDE